MFVEKHCDHCGKEFFPTKLHVYRLEHKNQSKWFCKYTCMLRYREKHNIKSRGDNREVHICN